MQNRYRPAMVVIATIAIIGLLLAQQRSRSPVHLWVGIDASVSYRPALPIAASSAASMAARLDPDTDGLTIARVDRAVEDIRDANAAESAEELQDLLISRLSPLPAQSGTWPHLYWQQLAERVARDPRSSAIAFFTDGDEDDPTPAALAVMRDAACRLAKIPQLRYVAIYGVLPERREELRTILAPLGDRVHLYDVHEITTEPLMTALENAGQASRR